MSKKVHGKKCTCVYVERQICRCVDVNLKGKEIKERERHLSRMRIREQERERVFSVTEREYFYRERHV